MNITVRQMRAFLVLAQIRNFTRAAKTIHLSQPAFSAMIQGLEDAVGARLFHRDTRNVELTTEGLIFEGAARRAIGEIEGAIGGVRDLIERRRGKVSIALLPSLAAGWLPPLLADYCEQYPGVEVQVADMLSERSIDQVRSGRADFAIVATTSDDPSLSVTPLCTDRFELVCRHDHRLANAKRVGVKDLVGERLIYQVRHGIVGRYLTDVVPRQDLQRFMEVEQLATVIGMVRAGIGIAAIPQFNLYDFHHDDLVRRELAFRGLERRIYIVRPIGRELSFAAQALHDLLEQRRPTAAISPT
jgi:DNA-binding transcriptional LysR family regulator